MKPGILRVMVLLGLALSATAQVAPSFEVTLRSERTVLLPYQTLPVTLEVKNTGSEPLPAFARGDLLPAPCFVAAASAGGAQPREGHWLARLTPEELPGSIGPLRPGEAYSVEVGLRLPAAFREGGRLLGIQWVGRKGIFEGRRSEGELSLNLRKNERRPVVNLWTDEGAFSLELWPKKAPNHVANFLRLVEEGFFVGQLFHRVVPGGVVQTGCADGTGLSDPGFAIAAEFNDASFLKGTIGMARREDATDSASTQWFVTLRDLPDLDGKYTAFGRVIDGHLIPDAIGRVPVDGERPLKAIRIRRVGVELPTGYRTARPQRIVTRKGSDD